MQKITPYLWFANEAEEAATYYTSVFKNSRIVDVNRVGEGSPLPAGSVVTATFEIEGQQFVALNGNPRPEFSDSVSMYVSCADQEEVDELWARLTEGGGEPGHCGWLKDRYGVSWQVIPTALGELMGDPDPEKSGRVVQAMLGMNKIDIQGLYDAYEGR